VLITGTLGEEFLDGVHNSGGCQSCHEGPEDGEYETFEEAHVGIIRDPSEDPDNCLSCHQNAIGDLAAVDREGYENSLHRNLWGEKASIELRGRCTFEGSDFEAPFQKKCAGCHTSCGQCHVSRPTSVGGGFPKTFAYLSHSFRKKPHMTEQCTACHGSRVGADFLGQHEGNEPDTHFAQHGMQCDGCHTAEEIHGDTQYSGDHYKHRYEVKTMPRCESCHDDMPANDYHTAHGAAGSGIKMQCQVCHSQPYKSCSNCHDLSDEGNGLDPSWLSLKIGFNPRTDFRAEYDYVLVRHIPVDPGTWDNFDLELPGYLDEATWKYTSPHNIRRWTAQTTPPDGGSCSASCHDSAAAPTGYFLRETDLYEADGVTRLPDYDANIDVVIPID